MSWFAMVTPNMKLLSWLGMKPVGMVKKSQTVPASSATPATTVANWWRSTARRVTS
jgi:hypothetical protein